MTKRFEVIASVTGKTFYVIDTVAVKPTGFGVFDSKDEAQSKADDANQVVRQNDETHAT